MKNIVVQGKNLQLTLDESNTTGAGRAVVVAFAYVTLGARLSEEGWLEVGYAIFKENMRPEDTFSFLRTKDKEGKLEGVPRYAEIGKVS